MRVGFRTDALSDERLRFMSQLGVEDVFVDPVGPDGNPETLSIAEGHVPSVDDLARLRRRAEDAGIRLAGVQTLHYDVYDEIMFGRDGAERQTETIAEVIENLGEAGIDVLGYQWNPHGFAPMRTSRNARVRGGATATAFDLDDLHEPEAPADGLDRRYTEAELWENFERFLADVLPVAEAAGVRLALHPADPPMSEHLGGVPRLFHSVESFVRAMDLVPSDSHGLKLCLGCFSEAGADVPAVIRQFGERDQIVFVHFRDVAGTVPSFTETFVDEGNFDAYEAVRALAAVDFDGVLIPDHVPTVVGDTEWAHRTRGYTAGYLKGLVDAVAADD